MDAKSVKKYAEEFNNYILSLDREKQNALMLQLSNDFEISLPSVLGLRYGQSNLTKLKRERIEALAGIKIFGEE
jgi:hypothetical protein